MVLLTFNSKVKVYKWLTGQHGHEKYALAFVNSLLRKMNFTDSLDFLPKNFSKTLGPFISKGGAGCKALLKTYEIFTSVILTFLGNINVTETQMSSLSEKPHIFPRTVSQSFKYFPRDIYYVPGTALDAGEETVNNIVTIFGGFQWVQGKNSDKNNM